MEESEPRPTPPDAGAGTTEDPSGPAIARVANYTAAIYGSILVAALVSTLDAEHADAAAMVLAVLATTTVFWLSHVWADAIGEQAETGRSWSTTRFITLARRQWPMIEAATAPVLALVLAWTGLLSLELAVWLALGLSIAQLAGWGMFVGFRSSSTWPLALLSGLVNACLGLTIVALKALVH